MRTEQEAKRIQQGEPGKVDLSKINFVVAPREFPWKVAKEVRKRDNNTCQGINDTGDYLPICVFEIVGIDGNLIPAMGDLGFNIDISHYSHNSNTDFWATAEAVRCQCLACHALYSNSIAHFGSVKKINKRPVYEKDAKVLSARRNIRLDPTLTKANIVLGVLTQKLYENGVVWEYGKQVIFTREWNGVGTEEQIAEIAKMLYAPKPIDQMIWDMDRQRQGQKEKEEGGVVYQAPFDWAEYHGIR